MDTAVTNTLNERQILDAVVGLSGEAVQMLCELVSHPSLLGDEASAQAYMAQQFAALGLKVESFAIDEERIREHPGYSPSLISYAGRPNVVGIHTPAGPVQGRSLILNGHIDVVPIGHASLWTTPPFMPRIHGDRLYGRGAADMKAGIVAYTLAFKALQRLGFAPAAPVIMQSVIEEECTGNGALACLVQGYTADAALIPEPGNECIMSAQMGVLWMGIDVFGVPVHAAYAHTGVAAIEFAQYLVNALRELERQWNLPEARHPMYCAHAHPVNFNLGKLNGGEWASSVPTHCRADIRIGYYPGKSVTWVKEQVQEVLGLAHRNHPKAMSVHYEISYQGFQSEGLVVDLEAPAITTLAQAHRDVVGAEVRTEAITATTDVKFFHIYGQIPATCYGPEGDSTHGIDEWVSIASMLRVTAVYALFMARWCGLNRLG